MHVSRLQRPVWLRDLMALVAAVAFTMISPAIMRAIIPAKYHQSWDRREYLTGLTSLILFWLTTIIASLMIADSGRDLRRACRRTGPAAIVAVASAFVFLGAQQIPPALVEAVFFVSPPNMVNYYWLIEILNDAPKACGVSVASVWLILALTKAGRWPSNWLERVGFALGVIWLVFSVIAQILPYLRFPWLRTNGFPW